MHTSLLVRPHSLSRRLTRVLDDLARLTRDNPKAGDDELIDYLIESGDIAAPLAANDSGLRRGV